MTSRTAGVCVRGDEFITHCNDRERTSMGSLGESHRTPTHTSVLQRGPDTSSRARSGGMPDGRSLGAVPHVLDSSGHPLDRSIREFLEPRFGHDFSRVRVHHDAEATSSARSLAARAYTVGNHIVFDSGHYRPHTGAGRSLLAHELAHVLQQSAGSNQPGALTVGGRGDAHERAATVVARHALGGTAAPSRPSGVDRSIQRDDPVRVDIEMVTPERAEALRKQGVDLPRASAQAADPRHHSDFVDNRLTAVGFGIYLGGYHLHVTDLDLPVLLPRSYVRFDLSSVTNADSVIYPSREDALSAIPFGPREPGQPSPMTYFRGVGGLVVPAYVGPGSAPQTFKTMIEAQQELGRQVSRELTVLALALTGGLLVKGAIGAIARVSGRTRLLPPKGTPPVPRNAPKPGAAPAPPPGKTGDDLFYKPKVQADPTRPAGTGATNKFGDVTYSSQGSASDVALARYHESVHSALSPKLKYFREFRADVGMTGYNKSQFLRYVEEALAETYAQLRVNGLGGLPAGIKFPISNGYVSITGVVTEAAIGSIVIGGTTYGVYVVIDDTKPPGSSPAKPDAGGGLP